jgi:drug/metabolite transporter (DMT)-like permease
MKPISIVGILLIIAGVVLLVRGGGSITTREEVLDIGDIEVSADRERAIPPWVGIVAIVAGGALVVGGMRQRS